MSVDFGLLMLENFGEEEGDEWEPLTGSVVRRLLSRGVKVTGEDVRKAARELGIESRKVDGKLLARTHDVDGLVDFLNGKMQRSGMRQPAGRQTAMSGDQFGATGPARR